MVELYEINRIAIRNEELNLRDINSVVGDLGNQIDVFILSRFLDRPFAIQHYGIRHLQLH